MTPPRKLRFKPGDRYGRLTVLNEERLPNTPGRIRRGWKKGAPGARCRCDCGRETLVTAFALKSGNTRSCGCLRTEIAAARIPAMNAASRTAGHRRSRRHPLDGTWRGMMARCYNPQHRWYQRYGGRGIKVWEPWHDAAVFTADIERELGQRPEGKTLDRIDNDGNYEPGNLRWATRSQQMRNRRPFPKGLPGPQIAEARQRREAGETLQVLAAAYGVSVAAIHRYCQNVRPATPRRGLKREERLRRASAS